MKRVGLLIISCILMISLFISCDSITKEESSEFRAMLDAYVEVQTETLNNYIYGNCTKEEFLTQQSKNIEFLNNANEFCPEEFKEAFNRYVESINNFKTNNDQETYDEFKKSLDDLYEQIISAFDKNNLIYDNALIEKYINEMKR